MKKLGVMLAGAAGFVLGSRAGRKPYESLEGKARQLAGRPGVQNAKDLAEDKVSEVAEAASSKVREVGDKLHDKLASTPQD